MQRAVAEGRIRRVCAHDFVLPGLGLVRLRRVELRKLADELGLLISVCHFPPGTSKWNKIEHRLFSFISQNWRGKPLITHEVIVKLCAFTTTTPNPIRRRQDQPVSNPCLFPTGPKAKTISSE